MLTPAPIDLTCSVDLQRQYRELVGRLLYTTLSEDDALVATDLLDSLRNVTESCSTGERSAEWCAEQFALLAWRIEELLTKPLG